VFRALLNALRFFGLLLLNLIVAVIGTAVLEATLGRMIPAHTVLAIFWKEIAVSVVCATLIGFGMWRTWRSDAAKWTWVVPLLWFVFGLLVLGRGIWGPLWFGSATNVAAEMRSFFLFTLPLVRAVAYCIGVYISTFVYPSTVTSEAVRRNGLA
jgi:hypothetical protein